MSLAHPTRRSEAPIVTTTTVTVLDVARGLLAPASACQNALSVLAARVHRTAARLYPEHCRGNSGTLPESERNPQSRSQPFHLRRREASGCK
jgi:hypothetical protein